MKFIELKNKAENYPLFKLEDVFKWFPKTNRKVVINQLNFWRQKGYLDNIRRGIYKLNDFKLKDPFVLVNFIYSPSYISLETALNYYSIIPDVAFAVTSVTVNKTKTFETKNYGVFSYSTLKPNLFFGFSSILVEKNYSYNIAWPEKAIFDYLYLRTGKINSPEGFIDGLRLSLPKDFNWQNFKDWLKLIPKRNKNFHNCSEFLIKKYGN